MAGDLKKMMTPREQEAVCKNYSIGVAIACNSLGGTRNQNFLLTTTTGNFVVRDRYEGYRDPARVAFDHNALAYLNQRDVAVVPPVQTIKGKTFFPSGDRFWEVFPAIPSRHFRDAHPDDIQALAIALAKFHQVGRSFEPQTVSSKLGPRGETDPALLLTILQKARPGTPVPLKRYEEWIRAASTDLPNADYAALPHTLIHGDIQPANILINQGKVAALVDLDWCDRQPRIYDLAFTILLCCAAHESPIDGADIWSLTQPPHIQPDLANSFLKTYAGHAWPLSVAEKQAMRPQIILSWCSCRVAGALKVEPAQQDEFLQRPPHDLSALYPDAIT